MISQNSKIYKICKFRRTDGFRQKWVFAPNFFLGILKKFEEHWLKCRQRYNVWRS